MGVVLPVVNISPSFVVIFTHFATRRRRNDVSAVARKNSELSPSDAGETSAGKLLIYRGAWQGFCPDAAAP